MAVGADQVATLRALLARDFDLYKRLRADLDRDAARIGYTALIAAAFFRAAERRFGDNATNADVVGFVSEARARFDRDGGLLDPRAGERIVWAALGKESVSDLDDKTMGTAQILLLRALIADEQLDNAGLDDFMAEADGSDR